VALHLRILLDTNILIPLQDSVAVLRPNLAHVMEMCNGRHQLVYHPASLRDTARDRDEARRDRRDRPAGGTYPACPRTTP
jgi:hypothetical protein